MAKKSDAPTTEQRVEMVYRLVLDGWNSVQIVQNISKKWVVTSRQAYNYVRKARTRIKKEAAKSQKNALERHIIARAQLLKDTNSGRFKLEILKDEAKLLGLYAPKEIKITEPVILRVKGFDDI